MLGTPPAFILSQDQTLKLKFCPNQFFLAILRFFSSDSATLFRLELTWVCMVSYCSVFKDQVFCRLTGNRFNISQLEFLVNNFFYFFSLLIQFFAAAEFILSEYLSFVNSFFSFFCFNVVFHQIIFSFPHNPLFYPQFFAFYIL